jgi:TfoX/Sxy family transcriptional regulator of competence genes
MVYSLTLADRVRHVLRGERAITEKKMFGGVGFLLYGNMLVGIWQSSLIVHLGVEQEASALAQANVRPFDVTGRPMKGWVMVDPDGLDRDSQVAEWIECALRFVETLPPK